MNNSKAFMERLENLSLGTILADNITSYPFVQFGVITEVKDSSHVDIKMYNMPRTSSESCIITDVRLLKFGTSKIRIELEPEVGDAVLLLTSQEFIKSLNFGHTPTPTSSSVPFYNVANMQAILVCPDEESSDELALFKVSSDGTISFSLKSGIDSTIDGSESKSVSGDSTETVSGAKSIEGDSVDIKGDTSLTLESPDTKLTGGQVTIGGTVSPTGSGALCGVPFCVFSGAPHSGSISTGA